MRTPSLPSSRCASRPTPHGRVGGPFRKRAAALAASCLLAGLGLVPAGWSAQHGPGDAATSHRRFDDVEHWSRVFDDPARDAWQKPDEVVAALQLAAGQGVADIGAGTGYFTRRLSTAVGPQGAVFAVEVEPNLVARLRDRAQQEGAANVVPVLASPDNPRLPPGSIDAALFVDAYHHVDGRREYLRRLRPALRAGARVVVVEWKAGRQPVGPKEEDHKLAREQVVREMTEAGFEAVAEPPVLPHQYVLVFRKPAGD